MDAERDVEKYFRNQIAKHGGLALKFESPGFIGVPDRLCLFPGGVIEFVEMKRSGGKLTPWQIRAHEIFTKFGVNVHTVYSRDDVDKFIQELRHVRDTKSS